MQIETYSEQEPVVEIDDDEIHCCCPDDTAIISTECPVHCDQQTVWGDDGAYWPVKL